MKLSQESNKKNAKTTTIKLIDHVIQIGAFNAYYADMDAERLNTTYFRICMEMIVF